MPDVLEPTKLVAPEDPIAELRKLNPSYMAVVDQVKPHEKIQLLHAYDIRTPYEEMCVQLILDKIEPMKLSGTEEDKVRRLMFEEQSKGIEIDSPEQANRWEERLVEAREIDEKHLKEEKEIRAAVFQSEQTSIPHSNNKKKATKNNPESLKNIAGLGVKSITKLEAAGIRTKKEFEALSYEQKKSIVGPVVADIFKKL